jgi:hypothetical protein
MFNFKALRTPYFSAETDTASPDPIESFNSDITTPDTPTEEVKTEEPIAEVKAETETPTVPVETEAKFKVKFNHTDMEITQAEAREYAQKGMNADKAVERAKQEARDAYITEQSYEWNGHKITTEAEYNQAVAEQKMREEYKELPQSVQDELIASRQDREQRKVKDDEQVQKETDAKAEQAKQADQITFLTWFKEQNGKDFDGKTDIIPQEVWQENANGVPLIAAYAKHDNASLRERIKLLEHNSEVAGKAPVGSVTEHGSQEVAEEDPFIKGFNSVK